MRIKMLNVDKKDNKMVMNYIEAVRSQGKDITGMHLYVDDKDLEKWQEEADAVGWPLQLWILSIVNAYLKQQNEGNKEIQVEHTEDGVFPAEFKSYIEARFMQNS